MRQAREQELRLILDEERAERQAGARAVTTGSCPPAARARRAPGRGDFGASRRQRRSCSSASSVARSDHYLRRKQLHWKS